MNKYVLLMGVAVVAVAGYAVYNMGDDYDYKISVVEEEIVIPAVKKGTKDPESSAPMFGQLAGAVDEVKENLEEVIEVAHEDMEKEDMNVHEEVEKNVK